MLADIYAVISPGLKYGGQRDAAALAVADDGVATTKDDWRWPPAGSAAAERSVTTGRRRGREPRFGPDRPA